jgi:hypothetical protein
MWCSRLISVFNKLQQKYKFPKNNFTSILLKNEIYFYHIFGPCSCTFSCKFQKYITDFEKLNKIKN